MLKSFAQAVAPVHDALALARSKLLADIRNVCHPSNIGPILKTIAEVIHEDAAFAKGPLDLRHQRTYSVRSGLNGLLDVARQTFKEATDDVHQHLASLIGTQASSVRHDQADRDR
jgi:DNA mismatch repair protein MSH4